MKADAKNLFHEPNLRNLTARIEGKALSGINQSLLPVIFQFCSCCRGSAGLGLQESNASTKLHPPFPELIGYNFGIFVALMFSELIS